MKTKKYYIVPPCVFEVLPISMDEIETFNLDQIIYGKLSPHMTPYVELKIKGVNFQAVLDTGAYRSQIRSDAVESLGLTNDDISYANYPVVGMKEINVYDLDFEILGIDHIFSDEFNELPYSYTFPIILGSKFIGACKEFRILPETMSFELKL